ncbi:membrane lipoprotein lipid attachment site-containing protein [Christiangramia forsetii]|uniref:Secreted protein n=2 Tax=Christiangramia forsetii TaxID=411153 RepID=A0M6E5_CHRFK|nr:membrane lipoprotein lipid attachment site-containing protein [Christiangramia forsetii]GGG30602.1 hypothetical protein GCM10011532_12670 [Christiangramia forsetii]CAL68190.1 secreted protein [Christiangramia forsetii KT0803]
MKRLIFAFMALLTLSSCSVDDDAANLSYDFAEITDSTFPEFFEAGKSYDLKLTYKRPTTCHNFIGIDGGREDLNSNEIFLYALTSLDRGATGCDSSNETNLISETTIRGFSISANITDDEVFIFQLWTGEDANGDPVFTTIEVPVGDPEVPNSSS